jgi:outer membrane protein assembly factor BamB
MKPKFMLFVLVAIFAAILLSSCTGRAGLNNSWPGLATDGETAYLASGQYVYAIDLSNGKEIWRYPEKGGTSIQFVAQPVIAPDGTVVIGSSGSDHRLVALVLMPLLTPRQKNGFSPKRKTVGLPVLLF